MGVTKSTRTSFLERLKQAITWLVTWLTPKRRQDVKVVILCLLAATIFWFLNALNREYSTRVSCPIRFNYDDSTYIAIKPLPTKIRLNVTGYGWNLLKQTLSIDTEPVEYTITKPLRTKYVTAPFLLSAIAEQLQGLRINYVVEDTVHLEFDRRIRKTFRVKIDSNQINLDNNYAIAGAIEVNPSRVRFEGPASMLTEMGEVIRLSIPATQIDDDYDERLEIPNPNPSLISSEVKKVRVSFPVERLITDSREVPITRIHFPENSHLLQSIQSVRVTYAVRERDALQVDPQDFSIVANFNDLKTNDSTIVLFIERTPSFIQNVSLDNPFIRVGNEQ